VSIASNLFSIKWVRPSVINTVRAPNLGKITLLKNLMTTLESLLGLPMASTYLETQSTTIKNILVAPWGRERAHEIDAPNSENLNLKNIIERHLISHCQVSTSLTTITCRNIRIDIFEKGHPIEPGLENLRGGLVNTNMTPIRWIKATRYNRMNLLLGDTSLNNAVAISLVQTRGNRALLGRRIGFFFL